MLTTQCTYRAPRYGDCPDAEEWAAEQRWRSYCARWFEPDCADRFKPPMFKVFATPPASKTAAELGLCPVCLHPLVTANARQCRGLHVGPHRCSCREGT